MRDAEKIIGNLIDKQTVSFISSVDEDGFPNTKAMLPQGFEKVLKLFISQQTHHLCELHNIKQIQKLVYIFVINAFLEELC